MHGNLLPVNSMLAPGILWLSKFKEGQELDYMDENQPYANSLSYNEVEGGTLVEAFMPGDDELVDVYDVQTDKVVRFCNLASLRALETTKLDAAAWLNEGCFSKDGHWLSRGRNGPLTAYGLFTKLNQPVSDVRVWICPSGLKGSN